MKPLMELAKRWNLVSWPESLNQDLARVSIKGCAHELEARLQEADWELIHSNLSRASLIDWIREELLGTAQEGENP